MPRNAGYAVSPELTAKARAALGIPQGSLTPPSQTDVSALLQALSGGGMNADMLFQLLALLSGLGAAPPEAPAEGLSPIEQAYLSGGAV